VSTTGEVTPIGPKTLLLALKSLNGIPSILLDMVKKGIFISEEEVDSFFESIPTIRRSTLKELLWVVKGPFGFIPTRGGLSSSMRVTNSLSPIRMSSLFDSIDEALFRGSMMAWTQAVSKSHKTLSDFESLSRHAF
jgi:hypothetical protein